MGAPKLDADTVLLGDGAAEALAATEAGELDGHINAMTKAKQPTVMKR